MRLPSDHLTVTRARRLAGLAALALLLAPVTACGDDGSDAGAAATTDTSVTPGSPVPDPAALPGTGGASHGTATAPGADPTDPTAPDDDSATAPSAGSDDGTGGTDNPADNPADDPADDPAAATVDPSSPFVVAATAVGLRSRDQVTQLHVMGVGTTGEGGLPVDQLPGLARNIRTELGRQVADSTMLPPPDGTPASDLVAALETYRGLAGTLAAWDPDGAPLADGWFRRLATTDRAWKAALRDLGRLTDRDLLADLAPLPMPGR